MIALCRRPGMSLVELLVVLSLISILLALLVPAVQHARAAADRATCQNNLRQIGLALHMYHDGNGAFPPGMSLMSNQSRYRFLGWGARLTPYLEQEALWRKIEKAFAYDPNSSDFYDSPLQNAILGTPLWILSCPSDPRTPGPSLRAYGLVAFTSYLGVEGTNQFSQDGVLYLDSRVRFTDVTDGTGNTLFVGERPPSADLNFGWWYRGWGQQKDGSAEMILGVREWNMTGPRYTCVPGPYRFTPGRIGNQCDMFHFWSPHGGGAGFLFVDGSLRFLSYSADPLMPALATRAGNDLAALPD